MIVLFGLAGSGKSLQGQTLADKYGWRWMSIGQLLRDLNDPEITAIQNRGELVPDELVVNLMHGEMMKEVELGRNAILDGYPRNQWQADWIVKHGDDKYIDGAIILDVGREELWRRLEARGKMAHVNGEGAVEEITQRIENVLRDWNIINVQESQNE